MPSWRRQSRNQQEINSGSNAPQIVASVFDAVRLIGADPTSTPQANTLYKGLIPKAWAAYDNSGTFTILDSLNVSGITDDAVGTATISFDRDFATNSWAGAGMASADSIAPVIFGMEGNPAVGSIQVKTWTAAAVGADRNFCHAIFFGRQA